MFLFWQPWMLSETFEYEQVTNRLDYISHIIFISNFLRCSIVISWTELNLNQKLFIQNKITTPCHNFLYLLPPDIMFRNCLWMRKLFLKVQSSCCHECMDGLLPTHLVKHDLQFLTHGNFWNGMIIWNIKID